MAKNTQSQSGTDKAAKEQMAKGMAEAGKARDRQDRQEGHDR